MTTRQKKQRLVGLLFLACLAYIAVFSDLNSFSGERILSAGEEPDKEDPDARKKKESIDVNWDHIINNQPCTLLEDENLPLPVVFMAMGRTGSSITWNVLAKMTASNDEDTADIEPEKAIEIVGRNIPEPTHFFNSIPDVLSDSWPSDYICDLQRNFTSSGGMSVHGGMVGFQWKPYMTAFDHPNSIKGFEDLASTSQHRPIRVIYQTRNPIDRRISDLRHAQSKHAKESPLSAHCDVDDLDCIAKHDEMVETVRIPSKGSIMSYLERDAYVEQRVLKRLEKMNVPFLHVKYEELYSSSDEVGEKAWMKIFEFLGRGPSIVTMDEVRKNFGLAKTTQKTRAEMISNFWSLKVMLKGTEYEKHLWE